LTPRPSAGLVLFREREGSLEVLLGHMGGPYWARKDDGAWSIPKGELDDGEDALRGALREFAEELGHAAPDGPPLELGEIRQRSGKRVIAFAIEGDFDPACLVPGTFEMEWPPRSGRRAEFPELDRVAWFDVPAARAKLVKGQVELLERLTDVRRAR
jgi:predicted NUDIX family NTP pyrophosphohydrolase